MNDAPTETEIEKAYTEALRYAKRRCRSEPLRTVASDAATDGVMWAVKHYTLGGGKRFGALAASAVRKFVWRAVAKHAQKYHNRPQTEPLSDELAERLAARASASAVGEVCLPLAVAELPPDLRDAVRFFYLDKFDMRACALLLGCAPATVHERLREAAALLAGDEAIPRRRKAGARRLLR